MISKGESDEKRLISTLLLVCMTATLAAGCGSEEPVETVDLNSMTLEEIEAQAKEEGELESAAMPDTWANWGETWQEYSDLYGISHVDTDMSSAEEISLFQTEGEDATKDIGDVGQAFGPVAEEQGLHSLIRQATGILFRTGRRMTTGTGSSVITGPCLLS